MITYLILLWFVSMLFGYSIAFSGATMSIGKSISDTDNFRSFQDAITPPWSTNLGLFSYAATIGVIGFGWYHYDWLTGVWITIGFFFVVLINKVVLIPKSESSHFRKLVIHSMINRHADFVKSGDNMRASAMALLLEKLGVPIPNELKS